MCHRDGGSQGIVGKTTTFSLNKPGNLFAIHPHILRHATGYKLANDWSGLYLGHKQIQHTTRYTELSSTRFKEFWTD